MEAQQSVQLQEILLNLTEDNFETTLDLLLKSNYIKLKQSLFLLVHNFFIISSCRPKSMMILSQLLVSLYSAKSDETNVLKYLPQALHDECQNNRYLPVYFFYCLMKSGLPLELIVSCLIDQFDDSKEKIRIFHKEKILKDDRFFYGYALFVPELIQMGKFDWLNYFIQNYHNIHYQESFFKDIFKSNNSEDEKSTFSDGIGYDTSPNVEKFLADFPNLVANNYERYNKFRENGWNHDIFYDAIRRDDEKAIEYIFIESGVQSIKEFINRPFEWSVFERCQFLQNHPRPIHVAAFFNSKKAISYLVSKGADLNATDACGRTVIQFSIAGGCEDMLIFDRNKCSYVGSLHIAAKFHRYSIFEAIKTVLNHAFLRKNASFSNQNSGGCSTTADTSDIEGDNKKEIKKTEIKTRNKKTEIKLEIKPQTKSKTKSFSAFTSYMNSTGLQQFFSNNIPGLGNFLHQAALSNCLRIFTSIFNKDENNEGFNSLLIDLINDHAGTENLNDGYFNYYSFISNDTPLITAIKSYNIDTISFLLSIPSVNINAKSLIKLKSPLHIASKRGYKTIIKLLISQISIDFNPIDINGRSPIFDAAFNMNYDVLKLLADCNDVNFDLKGSDGKSLSQINLPIPKDSKGDMNYGSIIRLIKKYSHL